MEVTVLGFVDDVTACECCGRTDLKGTVAVAFDGGSPNFFGVVCAGRVLGRSAGDIRTEARKADTERRAQEAAARLAAQEAATRTWVEFLRAHGQGPDMASQIASLGGFAAAREAFKAKETKE